MKKYNRDKRATYNARIKNINTHDTCDAHDTCDEHDKYKCIHIHVHFDRYNQIEYIPIIYRKTRNNKAQKYVNTTNAINDIFPEINKPHTAHIHRATATYHRYIPQETDYTRPEPEPDTIHKDTHTVKCIIMNDDEEIIYIGNMRRTRTVNATQGTIDITLHRSTRTMQAYERAIDPNRIIHSMTVRDIKAHDVEIYYI